MKFPRGRATKPDEAVKPAKSLPDELYGIGLASQVRRYTQMAHKPGSTSNPSPFAPFIAATFPEDAPAADVFKAIEENTLYGAAFKRIMGEIAKQLASKDAEIAELRATLEATFPEEQIPF